MLFDMFEFEINKCGGMQILVHGYCCIRNVVSILEGLFIQKAFSFPMGKGYKTTENKKVSIRHIPSNVNKGLMD